MPRIDTVIFSLILICCSCQISSFTSTSPRNPTCSSGAAALAASPSSSSSSMTMEEYDLLVIGGGAAGITAAKFAATFGKSSLIVEGSERGLGGDCTWTGCVPSKSLIAAAKRVHTIRTNDDKARQEKEQTVNAVVTPRARASAESSAHDVVDWKSIRSSIQQNMELIYEEDDSPEAMSKLGIDTMVGEKAVFVEHNMVRVGGTRMVKAKSGVVVATGATPRLPSDSQIPGLGTEVEFDTYEQVFEWDELPNSLTVVGGGPIGCELAQAFSRLGVDVTIVSDGLLTTEEPEVEVELAKVFAAENVKWIRGRLVSVEQRKGKGHLANVQLSGGGATGTTTVEGEKLLVAVGRVPNARGFGLEELGIEFNNAGGIVTDDRLKTAVPNIYAAGDCTGGKQFTHYAGFQGAIAARNILLPLSDGGVLSEVPSATFTTPEVSSVGLTEAQAKEEYGQDNVGVSLQKLTNVDRAICEGDEYGFIKIIYRKRNNQILGATVMAPVAGELISEISVAMKAKMSFDQLAVVVHAYPAYSIALQIMAAEVYYNKLKKNKTLYDILKWLGL